MKRDTDKFIIDNFVLNKKLINASFLSCSRVDKSKTCSGLLYTIYYKKTITMHDIAKMLNLTPGAASQIVEKLVTEGLLRRDYDMEDRRIIHITFTPEGRERFSKIVDDFKSKIEKLLAVISDEEFETLSEINTKLLNNIDILEK